MMKSPPYTEPTNESRAEMAGYAMAAFRSQSGADEEDALSDLLVDLMHFADRTNQDFDAALDRARMHYEAESAGEAA